MVENVYAVYDVWGLRIGTVTAESDSKAKEQARISYGHDATVDYLMQALNAPRTDRQVVSESFMNELYELVEQGKRECRQDRPGVAPDWLKSASELLERLSR